MKKIVFLLFIAQMHILFAGSFVEYPGSTFDKKLTEKAQVATDAAGTATLTKIFFTADSFEKVTKFYLQLGKEYKMATPEKKLDDGTIIKKAFFILDGASNLSTSSDWIAIQNPLIGDVEFKDGKMVFVDIRKNTTSILRASKK